MPERPKLYEIVLPDIYAVCDAWAIDPEGAPEMPRTRMMVFASIAAPITTIKAIRAHLSVRREPGTAHLRPYEDDPDEQNPRISASLTLLKDPLTWQNRLPSLRRHHHLIIARRNPLPEAESEDEDSTDTFYCFARDNQGGPAAFYRTFISRSPTPTIPQWAPHLWQHLLDTGAATPLHSQRINAWRCDVNHSNFEQHIQRQVAAGRLPV